MKFYSIDYLQMQSNINDYLKYIVIFSTLFILIVVFSLYMRHRLQTKYRDLTIIVFLFCSSFLVFSMLIILIVKIYIPNPRKWLILLGSYHKKDVNVNAIFSSSVQLSDGIIVKIGDVFIASI